MNKDDEDREFELFLRRFLTEVGRFCKDIYEVSDAFSIYGPDHLRIMNFYLHKNLRIPYTDSPLCIFVTHKKLCDIKKLKLICTDFDRFEFVVLDEGILEMNESSFINSLESVKEKLSVELDGFGIPRRKFKEED